MIRLLKFSGLLVLAATISGFSLGGEIGKGMQLAIDCKTDEALEILAKAEAKSGLTGKMAILEYETILREAGRTEEADAVRAERESSMTGMDKNQKEDAEQAILQTMENIRKEREKQTGSATCP